MVYTAGGLPEEDCISVAEAIERGKQTEWYKRHVSCKDRREEITRREKGLKEKTKANTYVLHGGGGPDN